MDMDREIGQAAAELRTWGGIAIVGAGASFGMGLPLTPQLQALLWQAIDADATGRDALAARFRRPSSPAKLLIGRDPVLTQAASADVLRSPVARRIYQHGFARLNAERVKTPSPTHDALAELLHRRVIETVISLNWDTLLEAAYRRRYGRTLSADGHWLYKPHGNAADPDAAWIFPTEGGDIPAAVLGRVHDLLAERPRALLIVGYSESDREVVETLIQPVADVSPVVRIGPNATGELSIVGTAERVLPPLLRAIAPEPETPGWEYVTFETQRGLGHALSGGRLGSSDVAVCPRLPEVSATTRALRVAGSAAVVGESGSGKSITAYQAAHDLCLDGWEVLRLTERGRPVDELVRAISTTPHRSLLIVDDAQALDPALARRLLERVDDQLAAIIVSTEDAYAAGDTVYMANDSDVATLAQAFRQRRADVLPVVRGLDSHVGDGYLDTSLEDRIAEAARSGTPWQFIFVLTGGEQRAREAVAIARNKDRADLLLAAIASRQIVLLDGDVPRRWVETTARALGRDTAWVERSMGVLRQHHAIIGNESVRCPHLRFAVVALEHICWRADPEWASIVSVLRSAIMHETPPLRGIAFLLQRLEMINAFGIQPFASVVDDATFAYLSERCWMATMGSERGGAAFLLDRLWHWHPDGVGTIAAHGATVGRWLEEVDGDAAPGIGHLLNDLGQQHHDLTKALCDHAAAARIAASLAQATWSDAASWGYLLGRLPTAATREWQRTFAGALDAAALQSLVERATAADLSHLSALAMGVMALDHALAIELVKRAVPVITRAMNTAPVATFRRVQDIVWFVLGYMPMFLRRRTPTSRQRAVARRLARSLDAGAIAQAIPIGRRRDWEVISYLLAFLHEATPGQARDVAAAIDLGALNRTTAGMWSTMPRELVSLLRALAVGADYEPMRSWINRHAADIGRLDLSVAVLAPEATVHGLRAGLSLDLNNGAPGFPIADWGLAALAVLRLAEVDEPRALQVVNSNYGLIAASLSNLQAATCDGLPHFLTILQQGAPAVLGKVMQAIDPAVAKRTWADRLRGTAVERQAAAALRDLAASTPGPLAAAVAGLGD